MGTHGPQEEEYAAGVPDLAVDRSFPPWGPPGSVPTGALPTSLPAPLLAAEREQFLQEASAYMERHHVHDILDDLLKQVIIHRPDDPIKHMIVHLQRPPSVSIVVLSPQGSQRNAICAELASEYRFPHINSGEAIKSYLRRTKHYDLLTQLQPGALVPDEVAITAVLEQVNAHQHDSYILDGFPRTTVQAIALQENRVFPDKLIILDVPAHTTEASVLFQTCAHATLPDQHKVPPTVVDSRVFTNSSESRRIPKTEETLRIYCRHIHGIMEQYKNTYHIVHCTGNTSDAVRKIKIIGPPASGKTTQCASLAEWYGVVHVDAVQLFRFAAARSPGVQGAFKEYIENASALLPHDVVLPLVLQRLRQPDCMRKGWVLESFPETAEQVECLRQAGFIPTQVIYFELEQSTQAGRVAQRMYDPVTGKVYYGTVDDADVVKRLQRSKFDDPESTAKRTMSIQRQKGNLHKAFLDGVTTLSSNDIHSPQDVFNRVLEHVERTL